MFYRVRRFIRTLFPRIQDKELAWARSLLPGEAWSLFRKQSLSEQRHALDVAKDLARRTKPDPKLIPPDPPWQTHPDSPQPPPDPPQPPPDLPQPGRNPTGLQPDPRQIRTLLTAALLHDCGKSRIDIKMKHRVLAVLLSPKRTSPKPLLSRLALRSKTAALALDIYDQHASWSYDLASEAGLDEAVQILIREHHRPQSHLGELLEQADKRH